MVQVAPILRDHTSAILSLHKEDFQETQVNKASGPHFMEIKLI